MRNVISRVCGTYSKSNLSTYLLYLSTCLYGYVYVEKACLFWLFSFMRIKDWEFKSFTISYFSFLCTKFFIIHLFISPGNTGYEAYNYPLTYFTLSDSSASAYHTWGWQMRTELNSQYNSHLWFYHTTFENGQSFTKRITEHCMTHIWRLMAVAEPLISARLSDDVFGLMLKPYVTQTTNSTAMYTV